MFPMFFVFYYFLECLYFISLTTCGWCRSVTATTKATASSNMAKISTTANYSSNMAKSSTTANHSMAMAIWTAMVAISTTAKYREINNNCNAFSVILYEINKLLISSNFLFTPHDLTSVI